MAFLLRRLSGFASYTSVRNTPALFRRSLVALAVPEEPQRPSESLKFEQKLLQDLNPSQIDAITQPLNSITRVIAGPGSGKTRVLTSRIAYILNNDRRNNVLAVTFTKKAATEMERRVFEIIGKPTPRVNLGTFHSICARILRYNGSLLSNLPSVVADMSKSQNQTILDGGFTIIDQADQMRILKEILKIKNIDLKSFKDVKPLNVINAMGRIKAELAMEMSNPLASKKDVVESDATKVAKSVYIDFRDQLLSNNSLDFDDLIYLARELLMNFPDVRARLQSLWTHILVDEFQDTSESQMDIIKLLSSESLLVVGDADQSIYSWRGAKPTSLMDFGEEFESVNTVHLMENYRSTANIVKAAQMVIANSGQVSGASKLRQAMIPKRSSGVAPRIVACADGKTEAEFIVKKVTQMIATGEYGVDHTIAFIYRTNAQSRALEEACVQNNLPYVIFGSATSFYKRQEVKDCLCYLRFLYNGRNKEAFLRAAKTPRRGIGDTAIAEFEEFYESTTNMSRYDALQLLLDEKWANDQSHPLSKRSLKPLQAFAQQLARFRLYALSETVEKLLAKIIQDVELLAHIDKNSKSKDEFIERKSNVEELQQATRKYSKEGPALSETTDKDDLLSPSALGHFLDDVALVTDIDNSAKNTEKRVTVSLMTIHASKGMEFDSVFFVGVEDGTIPSAQSINSGRDSIVFEEEKRLCYVAMTRAKSELVMSWRKEAAIFTGTGMVTVTKKRSRFLDAIALQPVERDQGAMRRASSSAKSSQSFGLRSYHSSPAGAPTRRSHARKTSGEAASSMQSSPPPQRRYHGTAKVYDDRMALPELRTIQNGREGHVLPKKENKTVRRKPNIFESAKPIAPRTADASWFFPVGSTVLHETRGKGIVLQSGPGKMEVTVRFASGETFDFPLNGSEIIPALP